MFLHVCCVVTLGPVCSGCANPLAREPRPPLVPAPLLAPYHAAIATAEAGGDVKIQPQADYERGNVQLDQGDTTAAVAGNSAANAELDRALRLSPHPDDVAYPSQILGPAYA